MFFAIQILLATEYDGCFDCIDDSTTQVPVFADCISRKPQYTAICLDPKGILRAACHDGKLHLLMRWFIAGIRLIISPSVILKQPL